MKKIKYTIYTENTPQLRPLLDRYLEGYTIHIGEGRWSEMNEQSAIVTYIADAASSAVSIVANQILLDCKQDSVYLETQKIELKEFTKAKEVVK